MAVTEHAQQFLEGTRRKRRREIVSPEGVPLNVEIASIGDRISAYFIDTTILLGASLVFYLVLVLLMRLGLVGDLMGHFLLTLLFVASNVYFLHFELRWQGATPGKRLSGIRVIDRRGGPLVPSAVIARNLIRDFEILIPLEFLIAGGTTERWFALIWMVCISLLPFFNRERMRAGDFIGGTMVISLPRRTLLDDLAEGEFHFTFTDRQLMAYGTFELQILEELLRRTTGPDADVMLREVGEKIRRKIGWTVPVPPEQEVHFLRDFYTAERAYLEREQLFGKVKPDKHHLSQPRQNGNGNGNGNGANRG